MKEVNTSYAGTEVPIVDNICQTAQDFQSAGHQNGRLGVGDGQPFGREAAAFGDRFTAGGTFPVAQAEALEN